MKTLNFILGAVFAANLLIASPAHAIKKCKDADGKWHYGDVAVRACQQSKVTTLNNRGFVTEEKSAPKTKEELKAEEIALAAIAKEKARIKAEQDERSRILSVYETESDIDRQRDNQLNSVDSSIAVQRSYLKAMDGKVTHLNDQASGLKGKAKENVLAKVDGAKLRIEDSNKELQKLIEQKSQIMERFAREKEIYLSLKEELRSN